MLYRLQRLKGIYHRLIISAWTIFYNIISFNKPIGTLQEIALYSVYNIYFIDFVVFIVVAKTKNGAECGWRVRCESA